MAMMRELIRATIFRDRIARLERLLEVLVGTQYVSTLQQQLEGARGALVDTNTRIARDLALILANRHEW